MGYEDPDNIKVSWDPTGFTPTTLSIGRILKDPRYAGVNVVLDIDDQLEYGPQAYDVAVLEVFIDTGTKAALLTKLLPLTIPTLPAVAGTVLSQVGIRSGSPVIFKNVQFVAETEVRAYYAKVIHAYDHHVQPGALLMTREQHGNTLDDRDSGSPTLSADLKMLVAVVANLTLDQTHSDGSAYTAHSSIAHSRDFILAAFSEMRPPPVSVFGDVDRFFTHTFLRPSLLDYGTPSLAPVKFAYTSDGDSMSRLGCLSARTDSQRAGCYLAAYVAIASGISPPAVGVHTYDDVTAATQAKRMTQLKYLQAVDRFWPIWGLWISCNTNGASGTDMPCPDVTTLFSEYAIDLDTQTEVVTADLQGGSPFYMLDPRQFYQSSAPRMYGWCSLDATNTRCARSEFKPIEKRRLRARLCRL